MNRVQLTSLHSFILTRVLVMRQVINVFEMRRVDLLDNH
jgi:hypothetical protein